MEKPPATSDLHEILEWAKWVRQELRWTWANEKTWIEREHEIASLVREHLDLKMPNYA